MKTQTRITLLLAVVALLFIGGFFSVRGYEQRREALAVTGTIREKNTLFDRILRYESASLELFAYDVSNRDDIVAIAGGGSLTGALMSLEHSLPSFNVAAVWVLDASLRCVTAINPDGISGVEQLVADSRFVRELSSRSFFSHFFMDTDAGPVEFRTAPVQPAADTERTTTPRGVLLAGRLWSPAYVRDLEVVTDCSLAIEPIGEQETLESAAYDPRTGTVRFSRVMYGWDKKPLRQIRISGMTPLAREMRAAARRQFALVVGFAIAVIGLLSVLLILWVNLPLKRISDSLHREDPTRLKNLPAKATEFGNLARLVLSFFRQRDELREALEASRRKEAETGALLAAARAVLEHHEFADAARSILALALNLSGATAGFIAVLDEQGTAVRVLCSVFPEGRAAQPVMPVQGIYAEACASGSPCFSNDPIDELPTNHARIENILCVPLLIGQIPAALLTLANKPGGFAEPDVSMAAAFSELSSVALLNSRTLESLEASEERFRSVVATAGDAIITVTGDDRILFWNQGAERIFGYRPDEVINRSAAMLLPERLRPEYAQQTGASVRDGALPTCEMIGRRRDGSEFPMELSRSRWSTKDGTFFTAIIRDITERKQAEANLKESEQRLRMQDKMASLGRVAAGIAHEIRNPLTGINSYVYMLRRHAEAHPSNKELHEIIEALQTASDRIEAVIRRVMDFSKPGAPKMAPLAVNDAVATAINLAAVTLRTRGVELATDLAEGLPPCRADRALIEQAVLNLLTNAVQALQDRRGQKQIEVRTRRDGDAVVVTVADSGPGVAPEDRSRIFDPFFTTKSDGSGIGLSLCQRIAADHRGELTVTTSRWGGAEFRMVLPIEQAQRSTGEDL